MAQAKRGLRTACAAIAITAAAGLPAAACAQDSVVGQGPDTPLDLPGDVEVAAPRIGTGSLALPRGDVIGFDESDRTATSGRGGLGTTVLARARPAYNPTPHAVGNFSFFPALTADIGYNSNVYVQQRGSDDAFGDLRAAAALNSNWGRHALSVEGFVNERAYTKYDTDSGLTYRVRGKGVYEVTTGLKINARVNQERSFARRTGTGEFLRTRKPVRFDLTSLQLGAVQDLNHFTMKLDGLIARYDYHNAETPEGEFLSQQYRDSTNYTFGGEVDWRPGAGPALFVNLIEDIRRYRVPFFFDRDTNSTEILGGVSSEITPLLRGRIGAGYLRVDFKDPAVRSRGAVTFDADLDYLVTELTTVKLTARRYLQNVASPRAPAGFGTEATLGVDHELLRNLILSTAISYRKTSYLEIDTNSSSFGISGNALWLIGPKLRANLSAEYVNRRGRIDGLGTVLNGGSFSQLTTSVGLTFTP